MRIEIKVLKLHMFDLLHLFEYFQTLSYHFLLMFMFCPNNVPKMSENLVQHYRGRKFC